LHPHRLKRGAELVKFCTYTSCIVPFSTSLSLSCGNSWSSAAYVQPFWLLQRRWRPSQIIHILSKYK
jgi:hypothetical protein